MDQRFLFFRVFGVFRGHNGSEQAKAVEGNRPYPRNPCGSGSIRG